ncbi:Protein CBG21870 [Caenorhabditis briggsae]|uniref:Protein CBG21870 n=1 Tax=Caenorhabditis briggsae TaxID=6238 RepID=A8Y110_CAEBR|nr:Protein CBG21870 [Caenorhabditis briggsae]CAP38579.2 Protein CBG21870 [Caenorhabditis briggsae]
MRALSEAREVLGNTEARDSVEAEVEKEESSASSAPSMVTLPQNVNKEGMSFPDRLSAAIDFWEKICDVEWILSVIEDGFKIQLNSNVVLPEPQGLRPSVIRHKEFLVAEIERLEAEGVLTRSDHQPRCVSPLHVVEQGKKKRMILDLSELNESLVPPRFKLENLKTAWPFLEDARYAATFDFKSGYHPIKIHKESQDLLSFTLTNPPTAPYFSFRGLPFGLSTAPWLFTKIFKVFVLKWRAEGIKIFLYLDDGLIVGKTEREVARAVKKVREDLNSAGVCVAEEKSFWVPDAKFTWLGYECDLVAREVRGTEKRMAKWQVALEELRRSVAPTVLDRMKFLGCLASFELVAGDVGVGRARSIMQTVEGVRGRRVKGAKRQFVEELKQKAGEGFEHHIERLKMIPFEAKATPTAAAYKAENDKRNSWISQKKLPMDESSFLLYLLDRAKQIGSSALTKISAAYQTANEGISAIGASFVSDIIKSKRREESLLKKEVVKVTVEDVKKITMLAMKEDSPERDRDALLAILSFNVMLRASEAAEIKWAGVTQKDGMIEVHVEKAKNDQLRLGRRSFFNYEPDSDADILMCRWRLRTKGKCPYVFSHLDGSKKLSKQAISTLSTKMLAAIGKPGATSLLQKRRSQPHEENRAFNGGNSMQRKMEIGGRTSAVSH